MKKWISLLLSLLLVLPLAACTKKQAGVVQDQSPVTVLISSSGNSEAYFLSLAEMIKKELGIEIKYVYQISGDATDMTRLYFKNNRLPADIIFCASRTEDDWLKDSCIDLLSHSTVTALYTPAALRDCTTADGKVYQLPVSSKLIGITYNETLLNEMGWSVPKTFADMVDLKAKCDEAGIKFAISDGVATGHGFNWLFHLMGAQWLSSLEGTEWFSAYMAGKQPLDTFKEKCDYFKKWTEAGLWGTWHDTDWSANLQFQKQRYLFWYGLTNTVTGYEGPQYDEAGNETGVMLKDTYKTIPWISEDGANNVYTKYDNCWILANKALEAPDKAEKLAKVIKIIEFISSASATKLISDISADTYVSVNNYELRDDRLYSAFNEDVKKGYLQPWYYNEFDMDSIVFTGAAVNSYLAGEGDYEDIFTVLDGCTQNRLNATTEIAANFTEELGFEDTAKLLALSVAAAFNKNLEESGSADRANVTIAPYTPDWNGLPVWRNAAVSNSIVFKGPLDASMINTVIPNNSNKPTGIRMTGAELKELVSKGYDPADRFIDKETGKSKFDSEHYGPYPYVCLVKDGAEIKDDAEYIVALVPEYITLAQYNAFTEAGKVLPGFEDPYTINEGVTLFINGRADIAKADLKF